MSFAHHTAPASETQSETASLEESYGSNGVRGLTDSPADEMAQAAARHGDYSPAEEAEMYDAWEARQLAPEPTYEVSVGSASGGRFEGFVKAPGKRPVSAGRFKAEESAWKAARGLAARLREQNSVTAA